MSSEDKPHKPGSSTSASLKQKFHPEKSEQDEPELTSDSLEEEEQLLTHASYKELQEKLNQTEEELTAQRDKALRVQAEMQNMRRRSELDIASAHKFALEKFVLELLPIIDSLERAIEAHDEEDSGSGSLLDGVRLTLKMFSTAFEKFGVEEVNPLKQAFNPEWHQAVSTQADPKVKPGTVLAVLQKGYLLNKRLIRPALVVVSKSDT